MLTNNRLFPKVSIYIRKVTSMVKHFTEVRTYSASKELFRNKPTRETAATSTSFGVYL